VTARQHLHDGIVSDRGQYPGGEVGQNTVLIGHGYNITGATPMADGRFEPVTRLTPRRWSDLAA